MATRKPTSTRDPHLGSLLDAATEATATIRSAEADRFELAAAWAEAHPAPVEDRVVDQDGVLEMFGDQPVTLAGEGAPGMSEFAIAEFAAACGMSTWQGRDLIGAALEAKYRLPRIWARVIAGEVPVWKVRRVTEATHRLDPYAAAYVDRHLHRVLHSCTYKQIETTIEQAIAEADPEHTELARLDHHEYVEVGLNHARLNHNQVPLAGSLDYGTGLALEQYLQDTAHQLLADHPDLDLAARRVLAFKMLLGQTPGQLPQREVVIYTHLTPPTTVDPFEPDHGIAGVEGFGPATIEQLAEWCHAPGTRVTVRPVLDLDEELVTDRYTPTQRQREQAILTCPTCVFPGCGRTARRCDLDHITPHAQGGLTSSWNLAPLCRLHHRMKTHGGWTYTRLTRTAFEWTSPDDRTYPVDLTHKRRRTH